MSTVESFPAGPSAPVYFTPRAFTEATFNGFTRTFIQPPTVALGYLMPGAGHDLQTYHPIGVVLGAASPGEDTDMRFNDVQDDTMYYPAHALGAVEPNIHAVPKSQLGYVVEATINGNWNDPDLTNSIASRVQGPLHAENLRRGTKHTVASLAIGAVGLVAARISPANDIEQTIDTISYTVTSAGTLWGSVVGVGRTAQKAFTLRFNKRSIKRVGLLQLMTLISDAATPRDVRSLGQQA